MSAFEEQRKKEKQITKDLAIADINQWIKKVPKDKLNEPAIVVGTKTFTPAQLKKEVEDETEYGKQFANILAKSRVEIARRKTK
jgi:hypothetical protein